MPTMAFATFLIVCPTSFFLGALFSLFPYDYPLLWSSVQPPPDAHLDLLEAHLKLLHNAPSLIVQIFHIVMGLGLLGLIIKLYKPTESNVLFDGGSLALYMVAIIVYIVNTIKGLRIVEGGVYGVEYDALSEAQLDNADSTGNDGQTAFSVLGREDNLKVMSASNTILALVLVGVLVLQAGQWYAERSDEKLKAEFLAKEKAEAAEKQAEPQAKTSGSAAAAATAGDVKKQTSNKEGKKQR
ncbi:hypothetical protein DV737_g5051, partial [Chaetothyriales sp. CBS 132003]